MTLATAEGAACVPNLSPGARRLRLRVARAATAALLVAFAALVVTGAPWWVRALVTFPLALVAAIAFLEARDSVCVVGAVGGVYEDDARVKTPMNGDDVSAIRRVALALTGWSLLLAAAAAALAAVTALAR